MCGKNENIPLCTCPLQATILSSSWAATVLHTGGCTVMLQHALTHTGRQTPERIQKDLLFRGRVCVRRRGRTSLQELEVEQIRHSVYLPAQMQAEGQQPHHRGGLPGRASEQHRARPVVKWRIGLRAEPCFLHLAHAVTSSADCFCS